MYNQNNEISRLSIGLYQGAETEDFDNKLYNIIKHSISFGINNFDVAPNYRNKRSEIVLGRVLNDCEDANILVSTKGGFVPFNFSDATIDEFKYIHTNYINNNLVDSNDFNFYHLHSLDPRYLEFEFNNSLIRLSQEKIDFYYIHNPEYLLLKSDRKDFLFKMDNVFKWLKSKIVNKQILSFGISTWNGFFDENIENRIQINEFVELALKYEIIDNFKFIQFPFSLIKTDAFTKITQIVDGKLISLIRAAMIFNIECIASAPFGQGDINKITLPSIINNNFYGNNNFQKSLAFCMSAPYIKTIVLGTSDLTHLKQAIEVLQFGNHSEELFYKIF